MNHQFYEWCSGYDDDAALDGIFDDKDSACDGDDGDDDDDGVCGDAGYAHDCDPSGCGYGCGG